MHTNHRANQKHMITVVAKSILPSRHLGWSDDRFILYSRKLSGCLSSFYIFRMTWQKGIGAEVIEFAIYDEIRVPWH